MNCQDIARALDEQEVDGLLAEQQSAVQAHLKTCRDCARDWQIHAQLASAAIPAVPAALRTQFFPQTGKSSNSDARRRSRFVVIGALVTLAAAAATLFVQKQQPTLPVEAIKESAQEVPSATHTMVETHRSPATPVPDASTKTMKDLEGEMDAWISSVKAWLEARGDAEALLTAAILVASEKQGPPPQEALSLLKRASAKAPDSARIQATAMQLCFASKLCDSTPYEQALRRIAPGNALGWELEAVRASRADDQQALRDALARMAQAKTYDLYSYAGMAAFIARFREALVPLPHFAASSPAFSAHDFAMGIYEDELPMLRNSVIHKFCKSATDEKVLADCHQVGAAMRSGDSLNTNVMGVALSRYGLPAESAEARSLAQQERQFWWTRDALDTKLGWIEDVSIMVQHPTLLGILADHPREIDGLRAFLEERGIPAEPPVDWKCDNCGKDLGY